MTNNTLGGVCVNIAQLVLLVLSALGASLAAIFTFFAAKATKKASRGATLLSCLQNYISIMKDKKKAEEEGTSRLAEEFYRELLDLHWSEFHLWMDDVIPDNVMLSWILIRKRNFDGDKITCINEAGKIVTYKDCWSKLEETNYFEINDPFVTFMRKVHAGEITKVKALRKLKKQLKKELAK